MLHVINDHHLIIHADIIPYITQRRIQISAFSCHFLMQLEEQLIPNHGSCKGKLAQVQVVFNIVLIDIELLSC
jgi:hypothetical protein